jgi:hypothetical protein
MPDVAKPEVQTEALDPLKSPLRASIVERTTQDLNRLRPKGKTFQQTVSVKNGKLITTTYVVVAHVRNEGMWREVVHRIPEDKVKANA